MLFPYFLFLLYFPLTNQLDPSNEYYKNISENDIFSKHYSKAKEMIKNMTLEEKLGQLFIVRYNKDKVKEYIMNYHFGGFTLYKTDFNNHQTTKSIYDELESIKNLSKIKLAFAVDEEGGTVSRLSKFRKNPFDSPQNYFKKGGFDLVIKNELEKINIMKECNLNLNFAPVADYTENTTKYIYERTLGGTIKETQEFIEKFVRNYNKNKMTCSLKHFPGYGNNIDTHKDIAYDDRDLESFKKLDFLPFISGIKNFVPQIMVGHLILKKIDEKYPASLSGKIHKILREDLKYSGLILTDDLSMEGIKKYILNNSATSIAISSGVDIVLTSDPEKHYNQTLNDVKNGIINNNTIDNAVLRVLSWKLEFLENNDNNNVIFIIIIIFAVVFLIGCAVYFLVFNKNKNTQSELEESLTI